MSAVCEIEFCSRLERLECTAADSFPRLKKSRSTPSSPLPDLISCDLSTAPPPQGDQRRIVLGKKKLIGSKASRYYHCDDCDLYRDRNGDRARNRM